MSKSEKIREAFENYVYLRITEIIKTARITDALLDEDEDFDCLAFVGCVLTTEIRDISEMDDEEFIAMIDAEKGEDDEGYC